MSDLSQNSELFDAYLFNELSKEDCIQFEDRLKTDAEFAKEFESHKFFLAELNDGIEYRETIKHLKNIHQTIYHPQKNFFLSRQFMIPLGIAASVALLMLVISPFIFQGSESAAGVGDQDYLAEEISTDSAYSPSYAVTEKDAMMEPAYEESATEPINLLLDTVDTPIIGTAFMISNKGFFLTSKEKVKNYKSVILQKKSLGLTFNAKVIYIDSLEDFAILRCDTDLSKIFKPVPYKFYEGNLKQHKSVFAMGYLDDTLKAYKGVLENKSEPITDTLRSPVHINTKNIQSGFPLFSSSGDLLGLVYNKKIKNKVVTYVLYPHYIMQRIDELGKQKKIFIDMSENYKRNAMYQTTLVERYQSFIFEIHPE